jgi:hypothetical protein
MQVALCLSFYYEKDVQRERKYISRVTAQGKDVEKGRTSVSSEY